MPNNTEIKKVKGILKEIEILADSASIRGLRL